VVSRGYICPAIMRHLWDIVGRVPAHASSYSLSPALATRALPLCPPLSLDGMAIKVGTGTLRNLLASVLKSTRVARFYSHNYGSAVVVLKNNGPLAQLVRAGDS
jgi:hypothetical protein